MCGYYVLFHALLDSHCFGAPFVIPRLYFVSWSLIIISIYATYQSFKTQTSFTDCVYFYSLLLNIIWWDGAAIAACTLEDCQLPHFIMTLLLCVIIFPKYILERLCWREIAFSRAYLLSTVEATSIHYVWVHACSTPFTWLRIYIDFITHAISNINTEFSVWHNHWNRNLLVPIKLSIRGGRSHLRL